jgi:hypothetical protein
MVDFSWFYRREEVNLPRVYSSIILDLLGLALLVPLEFLVDLVLLLTWWGEGRAVDSKPWSEGRIGARQLVVFVEL